MTTTSLDFTRGLDEFKHDPLTVEDYRLITSALIRGKSTDARNCLLCKLLYATGLGITELLRLEQHHILTDGPDTVLSIRRGKKRDGSHKWERLPINPGLGLELRSFILGNQIAPGEKVFKITDRQVRSIFERAGIKALGYPISPHQFRKLYVKTLLDAGLPAPAAAKMVGHADSRTTEKWYYELSEKQRYEINKKIPI